MSAAGTANPSMKTESMVVASSSNVTTPEISKVFISILFPLESNNSNCGALYVSVGPAIVGFTVVDGITSVVVYGIDKNIV